MLYKMEVKHNITNRDDAVYFQKELEKARSVIKQLFKTRNKKTREKDEAIINLASHIKDLRERTKLKSELKIEVKRKKMKKHLMLENYGDIKNALKRARNEFNEILRDERHRSKTRNIVSKNYGLEKYPLIGNKRGGYTHTKVGNFLELKRLKKIREIKTPKIPLSNINHIGVEIEFASFLTENQIAKLFYEEGLLDYVQLQHEYVQGRDSDENEYELCVISPENKLEEIITRVCQVLNEKVDANITYGCGLHVHLDARNRNVKKMFDNLFNCQEVLYSMVAHTRRSNKHVKIMNKKVWYPYKSGGAHPKTCKDDVCTCKYVKDHAERFFGLNTWAYKSHNTMEVRIHSGTSNPVKILNWIKLLLSIVDGKEITKYIKEPDEFLNKCIIDDSLKNYVNKRIENFKVDRDGSSF